MWQACRPGSFTSRRRPSRWVVTLLLVVLIFAELPEIASASTTTTTTTPIPGACVGPATADGLSIPPACAAALAPDGSCTVSCQEGYVGSDVVLYCYVAGQVMEGETPTCIGNTSTSTSSTTTSFRKTTRTTSSTATTMSNTTDILDSDGLNETNRSNAAMTTTATWTSTATTTSSASSSTTTRTTAVLGEFLQITCTAQFRVEPASALDVALASSRSLVVDSFVRAFRRSLSGVPVAVVVEVLQRLFRRRLDPISESQGPNYDVGGYEVVYAANMSRAVAEELGWSKSFIEAWTTNLATQVAIEFGTNTSIVVINFLDFTMTVDFRPSWTSTSSTVTTTQTSRTATTTSGTRSTITSSTSTTTSTTTTTLPALWSDGPEETLAAQATQIIAVAIAGMCCCCCVVRGVRRFSVPPDGGAVHLPGFEFDCFYTCTQGHADSERGTGSSKPHVIWEVCASDAKRLLQPIGSSVGKALEEVASAMTPAPSGPRPEADRPAEHTMSVVHHQSFKESMYLKHEDVEYYSSSTGVWLHGRITRSAHDPSRDFGVAMGRHGRSWSGFSVLLATGQLRHGVLPDCIRRPMLPGEHVEVFVPESLEWVPAQVHGIPRRIRGSVFYSVTLSGGDRNGEVIHGIPGKCVRLRLSPGAWVRLFTDSRGWVPAVVMQQEQAQVEPLSELSPGWPRDESESERGIAWTTWVYVSVAEAGNSERVEKVPSYRIRPFATRTQRPDRGVSCVLNLDDLEELPHTWTAQEISGKLMNIDEEQLADEEESPDPPTCTDATEIHAREARNTESQAESEAPRPASSRVPRIEHL